MADSGVERAYEAVQRFLATATQPVLLEPGEPPIPVEPGSYAVEIAGGRLLFQAWNRERQIARRIAAVKSEAPGRLECAVERFGKRAATVEFVDLARPKARAPASRAARATYRERFRRSLLRQFPGWQASAVTMDADLEHSFSPAYARALLRRGTTAVAAVGVPPEQIHADGVLTAGLLWLDYLRAREQRLHVEGLALFVPEGKHHNTCLRLLYLRPAAQWSVFVCGPGFEDRADLADFGNVDSALPPISAAAPPPAWAAPLAALPGCETVVARGGAVSWRVNGLEFAFWDGKKLLFGIETQRTAAASNVREIARLAGELARFRFEGAADRSNPLYTRNPESWLESRVRSAIAQVDAALLPAPVYGQVPAIAGGQRGLIDLLAIDYAGRLAVVEVKASEDLHLPLQSLDYWIRVKWHLDRDEFSASGYFPGLPIRKQPPRMLLVAPALQFHPTTETLLRYFSEAIEVERIGVAAQWVSGLKIAFRARGAESPTPLRDNRT